MKNNNNEDSNNNQKGQVPKSGNKKVNEDLNSSNNKSFMKNEMENKTKNLKSSKPNARTIDNKDFQNIIQRQVKSGKKLLDDGLVETFRETKKNENLTKNTVKRIYFIHYIIKII